MYAQPTVNDGSDRPVVPHRPRRSLMRRFAAHLRGDRYMVNAYPPSSSDIPSAARDKA